jgi:hypothetical protein
METQGFPSLKGSEWLKLKPMTIYLMDEFIGDG